VLALLAELWRRVVCSAAVPLPCLSAFISAWRHSAVACIAVVQSWKVWVEQGLQATPQDTSPISGMTGTCSGPGGLSASVEVFPGTGAADTTLAVPGNWSAVYGQSGTYLDSWLGVGGSGPTPVSLLVSSCCHRRLCAQLAFACRPADGMLLLGC
jgi:hypothetical protein